LSLIDSVVSIAIGLGLGSIVANQVSVRPTELDADRKGAMISGDPEGLISALSKLESTRKSGPIGSFFAHLRSGYPSTETRIRHLRGLPQTMPASTETGPIAEIQSVPVEGVSPTALITGAALAERVGTSVAPAHAQS
jgi:predicted Zn-dependent protease